MKASQQLRDKADILIREAEALLFERQRALREAIARRKAKPAQSAIFNALYTVQALRLSPTIIGNNGLRTVQRLACGGSVGECPGRQENGAEVQEKVAPSGGPV